MNPRLEACRNCPTVCKLQEGANVLKGRIDASISNRTSVLLQGARRDGCPSSEIVRIQDQIKIAATRSNPDTGRSIHILNLGIIPERDNSTRYDPTFAIPTRRRLPKRNLK